MPAGVAWRVYLISFISGLPDSIAVKKVLEIKYVTRIIIYSHSIRS